MARSLDVFVGWFVRSFVASFAASLVAQSVAFVFPSSPNVPPFLLFRLQPAASAAARQTLREVCFSRVGRSLAWSVRERLPEEPLWGKGVGSRGHGIRGPGSGRGRGGGTLEHILFGSFHSERVLQISDGREKFIEFRNGPSDNDFRQGFRPGPVRGSVRVPSGVPSKVFMSEESSKNTIESFFAEE